VAVLCAASCSDTPTAPPSFAPFSQLDLRVGTGTEATAGKILFAHYTGWLFDPTQPDGKGLQFETSRGGDPIDFTLGTQQVIAGWDQGLVGMKVGGLRRLVIPPSLAYGQFRNNSIPQYSTLVFEIELMDVQ
jgi:FKBP-type peptidyl-prolyl cis-trans isomerase